MTTRQELYEALVEANPEQAHWVRFEDEDGNKHEMPVFADSVDEARELFEELNGPERFGLTEDDLEEMSKDEIAGVVNPQIDGDLESRSAIRLNPDVTVLGVRPA